MSFLCIVAFAAVGSVVTVSLVFVILYFSGAFKQ